MAEEGCSRVWIYQCLSIMIIIYGVLTHNLVESQGQCQPINVPLCKGIPWNVTMFPNHMRQTTQEEAGLTVHEFYPLIQAKCSPYLQQLICAIYTPPCTWNGFLLPACKSFCISVRDGCAPILKKFGFQWPFNCDKPSSYIASNNKVCMDAMMPSTTGLPDNTIKPTVSGVIQSTLSSQVTTEAPTTGRCEPVSIPLCEDVNYKTTLIPNNLGHSSQDEAGLEVHQFFPLVKVQCSAFLKNFLCAVFSPPCIMLKGKPLPVCRSLCVAAKKGCVDLMNKFGFNWPDKLDCDSNSYIVPDNETCFGYDLQTTPIASTKPSTMTPTRSRCERLSSSVCANLPWNVTHVPNFLEHENQRAAEMDIREFSPIIEMQCSAFTKLFLCGIYSPKCEGGTPVPVCRSLCQKVRETCEPMYEQFGFAWPRELRCDDKEFIVPDNQFCVGIDLIPTPKPNTMHWRFTETRSQIISTIPPTTSAPPSDSLKGRSRCQLIRVPMCKKLPWKHTQMPNFVGDTTQRKARSHIRNFIPLVRYGCSKYLKTLVCAVYEPKCDVETRLKVPICASLCNLVKNQCKEVMNAFKIGWPSDMDCENNAYIVPDNQTCVGVPGGIKTTSSPVKSSDSIATTYHYKRKPTPDVTTEQPTTAPVVTSDRSDPGVLPAGTTYKPKPDIEIMSTHQPVTEVKAGQSKTHSETEMNGASTGSVTAIHQVEISTEMRTEYVTAGSDISGVSNDAVDAITTESVREPATMSVKIITKDPIMETHQPTAEPAKVTTEASPAETVPTEMQKVKTDTIIEPLDKNNMYSTEQSVMIKSTMSEKDIMFTIEEFQPIDVLETTEKYVDESMVSTNSPQESSSKHMVVREDNEEHVKMSAPAGLTTEKSIMAGTTMKSGRNNEDQSTPQSSTLKVMKTITESVPLIIVKPDSDKPKEKTEKPDKIMPTGKNMAPKQTTTTQSIVLSTISDENGVKQDKHKPSDPTNPPKPNENNAGKEDASKSDLPKEPDHIKPHTVKENHIGPNIKTTMMPNRDKGVRKDQSQTDNVAKRKPKTPMEPGKDVPATHYPRPVVNVDSVSHQGGDIAGVSDRPTDSASRHSSPFFLLVGVLFTYILVAGR